MKPGNEAREIELRDRGVGQHAVDDHVDRRRDQDAERAARRDGAEEQPLGVAALLDLASATVPIVAAVATLDPEVAANIAQAAMLECISPPGSHGTHSTSALYMRSAMPGAQQDLAQQHEERDRDQQEVVRRAPGDLAHRQRQRQLGIDRPTATGRARRGRRRPERRAPAGRSGAASVMTEHVSRAPPLAWRSFRARISSSTSSSAERVPISRDSAAQIAAATSRSAAQEQQHAHHDERREPDDPQRLRDHGRGLQRGLAARARGPRLRHDAEAVPGDQREEADEQHEAARSSARRSFCGNST